MATTNTTEANPFLELLERNPAQLRTPADHIERAKAYAADAERAMAAQIRRGGGTTTPPHQVAFAQMHAKIAEVMMLGSMRA
jgi:hypothetical protein